MPINNGNDPNEMSVDTSDTAAESKAAGYEMTDVNASGIIVFLGGLFGFVIIFFFFCFLMGRVINSGLEQMDGKTDQWHTSNTMFAGALNNKDHKREDLKSNAQIQDEEAQAMRAFPGPRLQSDDGNNDTYVLHAREDLLLDHYSSVPGESLRIPIDRAMELIAKEGLTVAPAAPNSETLAHDTMPTVAVPLTTGFARTGYELTQIEAREQRLSYGKATETEHAELKPVK